ncbi:MAG: hypothetical protein AB1627_09315 [Chloroflexota bacterium]
MDYRSPVYPDSPEAPPPTPVVAPRKKSGKATNLLLIGAAFVAVGGIAFAGGRATAPAAAATGFPGGPVGPTGSFDPGTVPGGGGGFGFGNASVAISGTVKSVDGTTMTITIADGTETVIDTSDSTFHAQSAATAADVTPGSTVSVSVSGLGFRPGTGGPDASGAPTGASGTATPIKATDVTITAAR